MKKCTYTERYSLWVFKNTSFFKHLESVLKATLFLLYGCYKEQELTSEIVAASQSFFVSLNDYIWLISSSKLGSKYNKFNQQHVQELAKYQGVENIFNEEHHVSHSELINSEVKRVSDELDDWINSIPSEIKQTLYTIYKRLPLTYFKNQKIHLLLTMFNHIEFVLELISCDIQERASKMQMLLSRPTLLNLVTKIRGGTIFSVEFIKAVLRLRLLILNFGNILSYQAFPPFQELYASTCPSETRRKATTAKENKITSRIRYTLDDVYKVRGYKCFSRPIKFLILGEFLWIIRPLVYLWLMYKKGSFSWRPWLTALAIDILSLYCSNGLKLSDDEYREIERRKKNLLYYLLRSPINDRLVIGIAKPLQNAILLYRRLILTLE
ncbi:uncharacterized protein LOC126316956 isoform X2 [Schistocerca gregaria]|uniref:uncharacterized protein LOC126316956 isoform X2 n=1 Tax=Schistocerca gregaria TaxID=7010 RepID=UPI00211DDD52|nr:uncharacterized protein LOC126316956 isoform X2 [Schistocerca gregaria]